MEKEIKIEIPKGYEIDKNKSSFEKIVFKKKEVVYHKTWEECVEKMTPPYFYIDNASQIRDLWKPVLCPDNYNILPSKEIAEKFLILQKLYTCRQAYIGNWKPDWIDYNTSKYVIKVKENRLIIDYYFTNSQSFSFPTLEMATEFLKNFKEDLKKIKDLL